MKKNIKDLLTAAVVAVLTLLLVLAEPFYALDMMLCDTVFSQMNGTGQEIKLIVIDEETLAQYGEFSTWSRQKAADLAEYLFSDAENAPAVLAYDIMFIGDKDAQTDNALAEACSKGRVVAATNLVYRGSTMYANGSVYFDEWNVSTEERPFDALDSVVASGFANAQISKDGFVRTTQTKAELNGETRYSFSAEIYRQYMEATGGTAVIPEGNSHHQIMFRFSGKPREFQHFSLCDVLDGKVDTRNFKDCIVMVGTYAAGFQDAYHSAADRGQDMDGVEINANIVRALMLGKVMGKAPAWITALLAALLLFVYVFFARKMNMFGALLSLLWVAGIDLLAGRLLAINGIAITLIYPLLMAAAAAIYIIIEKYVMESVKKRRILNSFKKYLAPQVIEKLSKNGDFEFGLGVEKRDVCVLFVDIRGFTTMSEILKPEEVAQILNEYLGGVTECIFRHNGMLDKYIGDAAMAVFNAPTDQEDYAFEAICAGLDIRDKGEELGKSLMEKYGRTVRFGVGINCGEAVVGNIGCDFRMDYTAIGDTVNTAARLEGKAPGGEILISEDLYQRLEGRIEAVFKEEMMLKGKALPVRVYSVTGITAVKEEK